MAVNASQEIREKIKSALVDFDTKPLNTAARALFDVLGYNSQRDERVLKISSNDDFLHWLNASGIGGKLTDKDRSELFSSVKSLHFLFQLTDADIREKIGPVQGSLFDSSTAVDRAKIESYLFFAVSLNPGVPRTRTALAKIVRLINKPLPMPALVLFRHGETLTLGVINRRLNLKAADKDVLEKVTVIKDISIKSPHRAHTEILFDLSFSELRREPGFENFVQLHNAWKKTLNIQTLNEGFFRKIRNWFYWARLNASFPEGAKKDADGRDSESVIRLLTRMIFCWFLREKNLIPDELFSERSIEALLDKWKAAEIGQDAEGRYYKAILQNLFFATLSTPIEERKFRTNYSYKGRNKHYGDQRFFRHCGLISEKAPVEDLYKSIPFLNGGLFENLDEIPGQGDPSITKEKRIDGFSDVEQKQPAVPDFLFFGIEKPVPEIAELLGEKTAPLAMGLLNIFRDYKFTIEENTPLEEDIALDPELLGRAFENLLAAVNPETGTVARKSTGSFYTPREIVNYMVDEAIVRYLLEAVSAKGNHAPDLEEKLRQLVSEDLELQPFNEQETDTIISIVSRLRVLDPACGSGAFPMGVLHRLVHILRKLDPGNTRWKETKLATLPPEMRQKAEDVFHSESFDYSRKLELIKDCIYGVDIQPTAIQISKLRFFLSLVIEQHAGNSIRPLPNLETKFVCANVLLGGTHPDGWSLFQHQVEQKEKEILVVRSKYFYAMTKAEKDACRNEDRRLRKEMSDFIEQLGGSDAHALASVVADWDPYKSGTVAEYFDPESMFGVSDGFDITIGNPPYVRADEQSEWNQKQRRQVVASKEYETLWEKWDLFVPFIERSFKLLRPGGVSTLIVSDAFCHAKYAQKPQNWFLQNARVVRLDFCSDLKIFDAAVHNLIYFFQRTDGSHNIPDRRVHKDEFGNVEKLSSDEQVKLTYRAFFPDAASSGHVNSSSITLSQICYISKGMVVSSDERRAQGAFRMEDVVSELKDEEHPKKFAEGKHLSSWLPSCTKWLEWGTKRAPSLFSRPTFRELHEVAEKILVQRSPGPDPKCCYDDQQIHFTESTVGFVSWHMLADVRNRSLQKVARYRGEKRRPDLPMREDLEAISNRFAAKYLVAVMNSSAARAFLRSNRRSNIHLYPDDWKKLPIPDVPKDKQTPIVHIVDQILTLRRGNPEADIAELEARVDRMVTELYGIGVHVAHIDAVLPAMTAEIYVSSESGRKQLLRDQVLPELRLKGPYFSVEVLKRILKERKETIESTTLNRYLVELVDGGFIFDAGRGWYSFLKDPAMLNKDSVKELVSEVRKEFPLLRFAAWSTDQFNPWLHHLIGQPVILLHVEKDAMKDVAARLEEKNWKIALNPRGGHAQVTPQPRVVVIRSLHSAAPEAADGYAKPEQALVELGLEVEALNLISAAEYRAMASRLVGEQHVSVATLLNYGAKRRLEPKDIFDNQLAALFKEFAVN
ncbi:MAG: Eco57I restriction-modification methylase domain-containing protein [Nitrospirae bacterium]|nr:Eco57I restriction-modification methylase domain-containing protein [Nitrospirota bacterium]